MRTIEEIEKANVTFFINVESGKKVKSTLTKPSETLILEVLLDCRSLLEEICTEIKAL